MEKTCSMCEHFHQHHYLSGNQAVAVDCGHCVQARMKHRKASARVCADFCERTKPSPAPDRASTIRYLTTEVLERIMALELPPEIVNREED